MEILFIAAAILYVAVILGLALVAKKKVHNETDFLAAGRKLSSTFASATLFATWFGAGTLLTATDAIYEHGLSITALEPFGAGSCLILAGIFFAKRLWKMKIFTVPDLFGVEFGKRAEVISALLLVPGYFGWIAVQISALSGIIHMFFGFSLGSAMVMVTCIAILLACLGGMWSVTLTDLVQMSFVCVVIIGLAYVVLHALGKGSVGIGAMKLIEDAQIGKEISAFRQDSYKLFSYLNVFAIAALGNLPGQDLAQRIFSAKSGKIAQTSCLIAGFLYVVIGSISILLGIASRSLLPQPVSHSVIPHLAQHLLSPWFTLIVLLAIISIILSTMDSAMLATSSILALNLIKPRLKKNRVSSIFICRICIIFVGLASLVFSSIGKSTYQLLEQSYAVTLAGLFAPFVIGLYSKKGHEWAAILSMVVGMGFWILGFLFEGFWFSDLMAVCMSFLIYFLTSFFIRSTNSSRQVFEVANMNNSGF